MVTLSAPADQRLAAAEPPDAVAFLSALRTIVKRLEHMKLPLPDDTAAQAWKAHAPAPRHVAALMRVVANDGLSVGELADSLGVSLATASQVVTDLESTGLVVRVNDPADRRRTLLRVADSHRESAQAVLDTRLRPVQRALTRMTATQRAALVRGLRLVAEELGSVTP